MSLCLVQVYDENNLTTWADTKYLLSSVALDGEVEGHANIIPFLWSAKGNKQLF